MNKTNNYLVTWMGHCTNSFRGYEDGSATARRAGEPEQKKAIVPENELYRFKDHDQVQFFLLPKTPTDVESIIKNEKKDTESD